MITSGELGQSDVRRWTILIVEDEEIMRQAVAKLLQKRGFSVIEAKDGTVALDLMRAHKVDIDAVLLDFTLPGIPGREVFQEVLRIRPDVKMIVTSAYSVETVAASLAELHADQFIRKPFQFVDLVRMLESALSTRTSTGHTPETPNVS